MHFGKWRNTDAEFLCSAQLPDTEPARTTSIDIVLSPFYDDAFRQQRRSMPCDASPGSFFLTLIFLTFGQSPPFRLLCSQGCCYSIKRAGIDISYYVTNYHIYSSFFSAHLSWKFWPPVVCRLSVRLLTFQIFNFSFRTIGPISIKLCTKHPWVKGIQVCSNEGPSPFPRGDNSANVNFEWKYFLKIFFSWTTGQIFDQTWHNAS